MKHMMQDAHIITVGLNPAIDRVIEAPFFRLGGTQSVRHISRYPAGKAINVSRTLAVHGVRSVTTGFVGGDDLAWFDRFLAEAHGEMITQQFVRVNERTRENMTIVDPLHQVETHLRDAGFAVGDDDVAQMHVALKRLVTPSSVVCFCGSLPPRLPPELFAQMIQQCIDAGAKVVVDTSGAALKAASALPLWMIKPNVDELLGLTGMPVNRFRDAAEQLRTQAEHVVVTMGADGAGWLGQDIALWARANVEKHPVINTVGCGDCLLGGWLTGMMAALSPEKCLRQAVATATANAFSPAIGLYDMARVNDLAERVVVESWKSP